MTTHADLIARYETYLADGKVLFKKSKITDGLFGFGDDPKRNPMHVQFFDEVAELAQDLAASAPAPQEARSVIDWMLTAEDKAKDMPALAWMLIAAQQHALPLIPYLAPADAAALLQDYETRYPRRMRLPIQNKVAKALKKQSKP